MKKTSWLMIISAVLVVIGIAVIAVGGTFFVEDAFSITSAGIQFYNTEIQRDFEEYLESNTFFQTPSKEIIRKEANLNGYFTKIDIQTIYTDVRFIFGQSHEFKCEYEYPDSILLEISQQGETLFVKETDNRFFLFKTFPKTKPQIKIYIPETAILSNVRCTTVSGDIICSDTSDVRIKNLELSSTTGDISFTELNVTSAAVFTSSGTIRSSGMLNVLDLDLSTVSGEISASAFSNLLNVKTVSGNITLDRFTSRNCKLESTSGEIRVKGRADNQIRINSVSGYVYLTVADRPGNISLDFKSTSGNRISDVMPQKMNGSSEVFVETVSGNLILNFEHGYIS